MIATIVYSARREHRYAWWEHGTWFASQTSIDAASEQRTKRIKIDIRNYKSRRFLCALGVAPTIVFILTLNAVRAIGGFYAGAYW